MAYRASSTRLAASTPEEQRSGIVFGVMLALALLAIAFPEMAPQALWGIVWTGVGMLMMVLPPEVRLPRFWIFCAAGFVVSAAAGFLPREWVMISPWRQELEDMGVATGSRLYLQPLLAAEGFAGFAITALAVIYLLGHRVSTALHHRLAVAFALGVGAWTVAALTLRRPEELFGFFPNRNHTANLLAMGTLAATGALAQAIRLREPWKIVLAALPLPVLLYALIVRSESRAGIILVAIGTLAWLACTGFRTLRGHAGKAVVLLLVAFIGMFSIVDSKVKSRLAATMEKIQTSPARPSTGDEEGAAPVIEQAQNLDGRVSIYQDTAKMIRHEAWTGVGPGQFVRVFPQHREKTFADNATICLHPESDWLMMAAETGIVATLFLAAGVVAVFATAFPEAWRGRARLLRMGTLIAASLLCFHGIFDVPGHRTGLAWAGALLLAISLRPAGETPGDSERSRRGRWGWRAVGLIPLVAGAGLLQAQWSGRTFLPSSEVAAHRLAANALRAADLVAFERAQAEGKEYQPLPQDDPIEQALAEVDRALGIAPLDPQLYFLKGVMALNFDDKHAIVAKAFGIQRRLSPGTVNVPLSQAEGWKEQSPEQVEALWAEALLRAATDEVRHPGSAYGPEPTYRKILTSASGDPRLSAAARRLAGDHFTRRLMWAQGASAAELDSSVPALLDSTADSGERKQLLAVWRKKGTKEAVDTYLTSHPES